MAKKKAKKKPSRNHTIQLKAGIGVVPTPQHVSKSRGDRVRWWNRDGRAHIISFDEWPFVELPQQIDLNPGQKSQWFKVYSGLVMVGFTYAVVPEIAGGPPDGPQVTADP